MGKEMKSYKCTICSDSGLIIQGTKSILVQENGALADANFPIVNGYCNCDIGKEERRQAFIKLQKEVSKLNKEYKKDE